jgi:uncharacterized membrane protein HdeD (DUF308 family)
MSRRSQWLSLFGGCVVLVLGIMELYQQGKWVLVILGLLIIAFTISNVVKNRLKEK